VFLLKPKARTQLVVAQASKGLGLGCGEPGEVVVAWGRLAPSAVYVVA